MTLVDRSMLAALLLALASPADADRPRLLAPGTGLQSAVEVDSGANGICETKARATICRQRRWGRGRPSRTRSAAGPGRIANTAAPATTAADRDRQRVRGGGEIVVDTGPTASAQLGAVGDDVQLIPVASAAPHTPCVLTGGNTGSPTRRPGGGDDVPHPAVGHAAPNTPGHPLRPQPCRRTTANNVHRGGDDWQRLGVGASCPATGTVVVDSGANGIAETRAQGAELVLRLATPRPLTIPIRRRGTASRTVKLAVFNEEFAGPPSRAYTLSVTDGSCPDGTVTQADADTACGAADGRERARRQARQGELRVNLGLADVTSGSRRIPFRCTVKVEADAVDTAPDPDDAANPANNSASVEIDAVDLNDL